jgi:hypothetical protein
MMLSFSVCNAQNTNNIDVKTLLPKTSVSFSQLSGTFTEGSTFDVSIILNTKNNSVNGIDLKVNFDPNKLSVVKPSGGQSIVGVWVEAPSYDNTKGFVSYVGVIPNGINTDSGVIGTITFKVKSTGKVNLTFSSNSKVLLNDGLGTESTVNSTTALYNFIAKAPDGVAIYSQTHPIQTDWYNNNNPVFYWDKDAGVNGFSFEFDNKPSTIPDNVIDTEDTVKGYQNLKDGLYYFHIKAFKDGVWGSTGHFLVRIDTTPPAVFKPEASYIVSAVIFSQRTLISFFTTDNLSGIDHYEVGIIDKNQSSTESPLFIQSESPFQIPLTEGSNLRIIVRAFDKASNIKDAYIDVKHRFCEQCFQKSYIIYFFLIIVIISLFILIIHYLFGHHIILHIKRILEFIRKEKDTDIKD